MSLSAARARRIALAAQGFGAARPGGLLNAGHVKRAIDRLGLLQIDSVNVLTRAHYLPLFSRLGNYDQRPPRPHRLGPQEPARAVRVLGARGLAAAARRASPVPLAHAARPRECRRRQGQAASSSAKEKAKYIDEVLREIADRGPLAASELSNGGERRGAWWGWNDGKLAVEWLFFAGLVTTATRRGTFERVYDLTERVLPADGAGAADAVGRGGAARAAAPVGRGAGRRHRIRPARLLSPRRRRYQGAARRAGRSGRSAAGRGRGLEQAGLSRSRRAPAAQGRGARPAGAVRSADLGARPHPSHLRLLLSHRASTRRVAKRTHGYYVLPFLLGDRLVARVDLKADRANSKLLVHAAHLEDGPGRGASRRTAARRAAADGRLARPRKRIPAPRRRAGEGHGRMR